ncbi:wall-associated receptor kinase 2-like protein, partial [Tanacetum coccineum]
EKGPCRPLEILEINLEGQLRVKLPIIYACYDNRGTLLNSSAKSFHLSRFPLSQRNKFVGVGCDIKPSLKLTEPPIIVKCQSKCGQNGNGSSAGLGFCKTDIPSQNMTYAQISIHPLLNYGRCGKATLGIAANAQKDSGEMRTSRMIVIKVYKAINRRLDATKPPTLPINITESQTDRSTVVNGDQQWSTVVKLVGDLLILPEVPNTHRISEGVAGAALTLILAYFLFKHRIMLKGRKDFFKQNGGIMLEKMLSTCQDPVNKLKIFTEEELNRATDNLNDTNIIGQGGNGTVYKGTLSNKILVAIKKSKVIDQSQILAALGFQIIGVRV